MIENAAGIKSAAESLQVKITEIRSKENERLNVLKGKTLAKEAFRKQIVTQGLSAARRHRAFSREHTGLCPVLTNCALSGLALLITKGISVGKRHRALPCFDKLRPLINEVSLFGRKNITLNSLIHTKPANCFFKKTQ